MGERYVIKDRWIFDTKSNKNIHSIDCYEEKNVLDIMNGQNERIAELKQQLEEKEKKIEKLRKLHSIRDDASQCEIVNGVKFNAEQIMIMALLNDDLYERIKRLENQLKFQPAEIVEKIRNICSIEDKCKDGSFVLGINEKDLDNLLKEYQK